MDLSTMCIRYRAKHNLSQAQMGKRCKLDRTIICAVECGHKYSKMTEAKILRVIEEDA